MNRLAGCALVLTLLLTCSICLVGGILGIGGVGSLVLGPSFTNRFPAFAPMAAAVGTETSGAAAFSELWLGKLRDGRWAEAFDNCGPDLQRELGSAAELERRILEGGVQPASWSLPDATRQRGQIELAGTAVLASGNAAEVKIVLTRSTGVWQILGFTLRAQ